METTTKKGIPYKPIDARQTTNVMIRLTESQKNSIRNNASKNNQTISEFIRTLAIKHTSKK